MILWVTLSVVLVAFIYSQLKKTFSYWKDRNVPFVEPNIFLGNLAGTIFRKQSFTEYCVDWYRLFEGKRFFGLYQFFRPAFVVRDLELIKTITIKDFDHFTDHTPVLTTESEPIFGESVVSLRGEKWKIMRSIISPAFTSSKMKSMYVLMNECAEQFCSYFDKECDKQPVVTLEMKDVYSRFTNDVVASTAFGLKVDSLVERDNEFLQMGKKATTMTTAGILKFMGYTIVPSLMRAMKVKVMSTELDNFFKRLVTQSISDREKKNIVRPDMIHLLLEAKKGQLKHEESKDDTNNLVDVGDSLKNAASETCKLELTDNVITAQALTFFLAGFDTSSTMLSFISYELATNTDIQEKLQQEIDEVNENCGAKITYDDLAHMKYLEMVIMETLRKWPIATMTERMATKDYTVKAENASEKDVHLPYGSLIWMPIFAIHRDPQYYEDPEKFDPERFNDENKRNIKPFSFLPFGAGPRNCIGSRFALLQMKSLLYHLLLNFDIKVTEKTQVPLKISKVGFNLTSENGFWLGFSKRVKSTEL